jgi:hypothetical protein
MLFRIIIIAVIIYYIFKLAFRFLLPLFISSQTKKMQKQQANAHRDYMNRQKSEEGKVTIEHDASGKKQRGDGKDGGEYVDYEEIK